MLSCFFYMAIEECSVILVDGSHEMRSLTALHEAKSSLIDIAVPMMDSSKIKDGEEIGSKQRDMQDSGELD